MSTSKITPVMASTLFNNKLTEMVTELTTAFPDVSDLRLLHAGLSVMIGMSPQQPREIFHQYVAVPYGEHVLNRNEQFLLSQDYKEVENLAVDVVGHIRDLWHRMSTEEKNAVWKYLQVLLMLNKRASES
jgi:hypothetical protein